jgi:cellulose synthase/poly-beta-1,6-N-acetylglucosamine synthase-like glycosyltransferase
MSPALPAVAWAELAAHVVVATDAAVLVYFFALNSFYFLLLVCAIPELFFHHRHAHAELLARGSGHLSPDAQPPVSVLVPAHNEAASIAESVRAFLTLLYPRHEVVVVNDGSQDETLQRLIEEFELYEVPPAVRRTLPSKPVRAYYRSRRHAKLLVLDKENGGKADALNAALDAARYPYVLACDADTIVEPDALLRLARPLLFDTEVAAVSGTIRVANACRVEHGRITLSRVDRRLLPGLQTVEYLRAFLFGRLGWNRLGGNLMVSGAFGLFRREFLLAIGGYDTSSVTEDMELCVRLRRYLYDNGIVASMPFVPDPVAWTEVPESLAVLGRQRARWHRGLIATLMRHRDVLFRPRYGTMGLVAMPYFLIGEMLAPVIEALGLVATLVGWGAGVLSARSALAFLLVAMLYGGILSVSALVLEAASFRRYGGSYVALLRLLGFALVEPFGYRQVTVWFRLKAFVQYARGEHAWGVMTRRGFGPGATPSAATTPASRRAA